MSKVGKFIKKRRALIIVLIVLIIIGAVIFNIVSSAQQAMGAIFSAPSITTLVRQDIENVIVASGQTSSTDARSVTVSGTSSTPNATATEIVSLEIKVGDTVSEGQIIATLDDEAIQENIEAAQESYDNNRIDISASDALTDHDLEQSQNTVDEAAAKYTEDKDKYNADLAVLNNAIAAQNNIITQANSTTKTQIDQLITTSTVLAAIPITDETQLNTAYATIVDPNVPADANEQEIVDVYNDIQTLRSTLSQTVATANGEIATFQVQMDNLTQTYSSQETANLKSLENAQSSLDRQLLQINSTDIKNQRTLEDLYDGIITAQEGLEDTYLRSPIDGVVTQLNFDVGDTLSGALCEIQDLNSMEIITTVPSFDAVKLKEGMASIITTDSTGTVEFGGTITAISPIAVDATGSFSVTVSIDESHEDLRAGVPAQVKFMIESSSDVYAVPIDAVMEIDGEQFVYVYDTMPTTEQIALGEEDGRRMIKVATGLESDYLVEIISAELVDGMLVLDDPQGFNVSTAMTMVDGAFALPGGGGNAGGGPTGGGAGGGGR